MRGALLRDRTVLVRGDRIAWLGPAAEASLVEGATVVACKGRYVVPGLWDMHVTKVALEADDHAGRRTAPAPSCSTHSTSSPGSRPWCRDRARICTIPASQRSVGPCV
jgi:imidazolonepropionase-like amidohydrolase